MEKSKPKLSNKPVAYNGAIVAIASVFAYSITVMIYSIIRSSITIYDVMPKEERSTILLASGFSFAYSVAVFSLLMAAISCIAGSIAAIILKKSLQYFNPQFNFKNAILISCVIALALLTVMYILLYAMLRDWMTSDYIETFLFWFVLPAVIFCAVCVIGGGKINRYLGRN